VDEEKSLEAAQNSKINNHDSSSNGGSPQNNNSRNTRSRNVSVYSFNVRV
jgi:hypothetical protein